MATRLDFGLLGPLTVRVDGVVVPVAQGKQQVLLAALLLQPGRTVSVDQLAEVLWSPANPPPSATITVQNYVRRLRHALGAGRDRIETRPGGYRICVAAGELDITVMEEALAAARRAARAGSWPQAAQHAADAQELWRGEPLSDVHLPELALLEVPRLTELRSQARELRIEADLHLGRDAELVAELRQLTGATPLREHLHALLMQALYRSGRRAEALEAYQAARSVLIEELGSDPGPELQALHQQLLTDSLVLTAPEPAPRTASAESPTPGDPGLGLSVPRQLPAPVPHFAGRGQELTELTGLLDLPSDDAPHAVVISAIGGTAGVGKTALAVRCAHQVAGCFPDGQLYVNLRGYDPGQPMTAADALARFLRDLGVADADIPAAEEERAARYRSLLAGRRVLVLLDNAREVEQVRPLLPGSPGCAAVVTSRDALAGLVARDGARRLDLDLLPLSDAVSLLRALIGSRVEAEPEAAAALAVSCARLPLALRVAAELAAARPRASLADLAGELAGQQGRLDMLNAGGDPRTAVRAVFSWSVRHLDPGTARAFRLLGLHPGPELNLYAAAALTGSDIEHAGQLLEQLGRAHLIQTAGPGRYAMHDLLRDYARELASGDDENEQQRAAMTRLLDYYLYAAAAAMDTLYPAERDQRPRVATPATTTPALTQQETARTWLAAELQCLVTAAEHGATHGLPRHVIQLSATLFRYLDTGGHSSEAVTIHGHARRAAQHARDIGAEATALTRLGNAEVQQGRYPRAAAHLEEALLLSRRSGDRSCEARVQSNLGNLAYFRGDYEQAASHHQLSLTLHREAGNQLAEAIALSNLGIAQMQLGRFEQAASRFQQALALARETGNEDGEAYALMNLGEVSLRQGRYERAAPYLNEALARFRNAGDRVTEAVALTCLGELNLRQGFNQRAAGHLHEALSLARDIGARSTETEALDLLGEVCLAVGDQQQAREHYAGALALATETGDRYLQARALDGLARADHADADYEQARQNWQRSLALYTEMGTPEADKVRAQLACTETAPLNGHVREHADPSQSRSA
jgi:DNA-binding SARP family transcriptional activator/Flp pilus assembly protein TadD